MPNARATKSGRATKPRQKLPSPVVPIAILRKVGLKLTLQDVCDHMLAENGIKTDRGTISAIENGHRGASAGMLSAYADALGIDPSVIDTQYEPRRRGEHDGSAA